MKPRLYDTRVGWFSTSFNELGGKENRVKEVTFINRWRLEKKDPSAALSEPIKPITYYMGPEIPAQWKPYVKAGVEKWNAAFEKAGFKNAIVCRDIPTPRGRPRVRDRRHPVHDDPLATVGRGQRLRAVAGRSAHRRDSER